MAFGCLGAIGLVCTVTPIILALVLPFTIAYYIIIKYYLETSRQVKRLDAVSKSPVLSHVSNTADGLVSVRAMGVSQWYLGQFFDEQAGNIRASLAFFYIQRWSGSRLDALASLFLCGAAISCVLTSWYSLNDMNPALMGLSMVYALTLISSFQMLIRGLGDLENEMTSVERLVQMVTRLI